MARVSYRKLNTQFLTPTAHTMVSVNNRSDGIVRLSSSNGLYSFLVGSGYTTNAKHFLRIVSHALNADIRRLSDVARGIAPRTVADVYAIFTRSRTVDLHSTNITPRTVLTKIVGTVTQEDTGFVTHLSYRTPVLFANNIDRYRGFTQVLRSRLQVPMGARPSTRFTNTVNTTMVNRQIEAHQ